MIVKLQKYLGHKIFLLECVMVRGVCFTSWDSFKEFNNIYHEVFFRKLKCNRDKQFYRKFDEFIEKVQGNSYQLKLSKVLFNKNKGSMAVDLEQRTFFCSELIVKCYKELGLIAGDKTRASYKYTPQDLSCVSKEPLELTEGNELLDDHLVLIMNDKKN